ncbi:peptidoglycan-binding protein [Erwiniaceae bacterium BAC15a-03b]|uniref:Peptidoglycan-binding protein n=1 Tax=Winslowiella arboricola TaxID=2978220 RepID=A0A9J6PK94_9GAMM|nr:peptidoglycan-binding protein [Winslowiella arboricola]MCU5772854.1 peptidoglycan-binding protein [Winslowiella arboricola]MCU5777158.1 peptidoglycan-binding protein [Winslowiella arboricola]
MVHQHSPSPRVFRLSTPVGACATSNPNEIKTLQHLMVNAGYRQATGRTLDVNGQCNQATIEAIRWYQRLLNMHPSGIVSPLDSWFIEALNNATSPHWRPQHKNGPLQVRQGQLTFDAEGEDYITAAEPFRQYPTPNFSRVLQWPQAGNSGVTLGRGYDMGGRSKGEIFATLRQAKIEEYKAVLCSKAAFLKGRQAGQFVKVFGPLTGEITHYQQIWLFEIVYAVKLSETVSLYKRLSRNIPQAPRWDSLDQKIRDVVVDIFYQGVHHVSELFQAAINGKQDLISHIKNDIYYMRFESRRKRIKHLQ